MRRGKRQEQECDVILTKKVLCSFSETGKHAVTIGLKEEKGKMRVQFFKFDSACGGDAGAASRRLDGVVECLDVRDALLATIKGQGKPTYELNRKTVDNIIQVLGSLGLDLAPRQRPAVHPPNDLAQRYCQAIARRFIKYRDVRVNMMGGGLYGPNKEIVTNGRVLAKAVDHGPFAWSVPDLDDRDGLRCGPCGKEFSKAYGERHFRNPTHARLARTAFREFSAAMDRLQASGKTRINQGEK